MRYVLVDDATKEIIREVDGAKEFRNGSPPDLTKKPFTWLPLVVVDPTVDYATEKKEGPVDAVTDTECTRTWTVRGKTSEELASEKDKTANAAIQNMKALILALNDGSFVPGQNLTNAQLKAIIKAHV